MGRVPRRRSFGKGDTGKGETGKGDTGVPFEVIEPAPPLMARAFHMKRRLA